jgi:uncharacterized protein YgiM (DUF1202 family)
MFKLTFLLLIGIGVAMVVGGRDLTPEEMASLGIEPGVEVTRAPTETLLVGAAAAAEAVQVPEPSASPVPDKVQVSAGTDTLATPAEAVEVATVAPAPAAEPESVAETVVPAASETLAEPETSVADEIAAALSDAQVWYVNAEQVNVREGPSTAYGKVGKVAFGDAIEILSDPGDDWVRIRIQGDGVEGYIARRFLQDSEPNG